jgi:threonine dehydrogenase-like Zn-dependent dehydrogenase
VIVVDHLEYRLEKARTFGAAETINFKEVDDVVVLLKRMTDNRGADVCIDAVGCESIGIPFHTLTGRLKTQAGSPVALHWAIETVRKAGHVSVVGVYGPPSNLIPIGTAMNKGITMRMNQCNVKRYMPHLLDHIRAGLVNAKALITHRMPLEEIDEAYRMFAHKRDGVIKAVLIPPSARA